MENLEKKTAGAPIAEGLIGILKYEIEKRKKKPLWLLLDAVTFGAVFLFARWHMLFGAYPLALSFLAVSPSEVWVALSASVLGSLSMGRGGAIRAMSSIIVVFLRVLISGGKKDGERAMFSESLVLRLALSLIGAFIGSVYELLLGGLTSSTIVYTLVSCLSGVGFSLVFYGLFGSGIGFFDLAFGRSAVFDFGGTSREKYKKAVFQASLLAFIFLLSLAASEYTLLGIDLVFVIAGVLTLFTAKRFGPIRAMAVGFVATLGVSGIYSVAFALLGLGAGLLFPIGHIYAFVAGGALLSGWSAYMGGLQGFLSTLPEYAASLSLFFPFLRLFPKEECENVREEFKKCAADMVSSMALCHRNERGGSVDRLSVSVASLASVIRRFGADEEKISVGAIREFLIPGVKNACSFCPEYYSCLMKNPAPCAEIISELSEIIYRDSRVPASLGKLLPEYCANGKYLSDKLSEEYGELLRTRYKSKMLTELSEEYELIAKLINEARGAEEREYAVDKMLSDKLERALLDAGIGDGVVKAYGERQKRFIAAGLDKDGDKISSKELFDGISEISGYKTGTPEFYRKGDVALADFKAAPVYSVEYAKSSAAAPSSSVSGDTAISFSCDDGYFYSLLSDGAGSGERAHIGSEFVADFLMNMLSASVSDNTALHILNHIIRRKGEDHAATLDLFRFDLLRGEALFLKSGAAASYVKRENSLFRIRSESAPLGLLKNIDSERIRVECREGDLVIMLSDGVAGSREDAAWLAEFLSKPFYGTLPEYADKIIAAALKNSASRDDMTVSLAKITKIA